ncbi:transposase, partial [Neoroseomonas lacus]|uniref:transposase n=1 Tax=Neoroseomonas lacus TaxID=287609 RepID=UPI00166E7112
MAAAALRPSAGGRPLEICFQDEARVGQQGTLTRIWARRGGRPERPRDVRYTSAWLFGAICPSRGVGAALVLPEANTDAMNRHLAEIGQAIAPGAHGPLVSDQARWHTTGALVLPDNMSLLHLPPVSPELNPVVNVWEFLRANRLPFQ